MAIKMNREYRDFASAEFRADEENGGYVVTGFATTYDDPYVLFEEDGVQYKEQIARGALDEADLSDVIFLYNHEGMVYARNNKTETLKLDPEDEGGFKVDADLRLLEGGRELAEAIKTGLVDKMSWAFTVAEDSYDRETHTRTINRVKKVYDVSAVSIPANPDTTISARAFFDGEIEKEKAERLEAERKETLKRMIEIKAKL